MVRRRGRLGCVGIAAVVAAAGLSGCSGDTPVRTVRIGVIAPLSGALAASGLGIRNGVDLAVDQANRRQAVKGWRIRLVAEDDTATPDLGANAATRLSDDASVMAVVGPLNSTVAERTLPILDAKHVVTISPANTDPTLTRGTDKKTAARPYPYYFRVAATDLAQGPFAATFAYQDAGRRTAAVVHDTSPYGQGVALQFKARFERLGGRVPAVETIDADATDFSPVLTRIKRANPDLVYFGGEYPAAAKLTTQAKQQGIKAPLMGGYGMFDPAYVTGAGDAAVGDLATSASAFTDQLPAAKPFIAAYTAAGYSDPYEAYAAYAYDAANVVIAALGRVLAGQPRVNDDLRDKLRRAVQDTATDGVTGPVAFDPYGDRTSPSLTIYEVEKDVSGKPAWKARETSQIQSGSWE
jgi:branched-chain amino acid transport system substrate-binding protein